MTYAARPFVCGAIGRWTDVTMSRLRAAAPQPLRTIHHAPGACLWATADVTRWTGPDGDGYLWWPLATGVTPRSWAEAAERRLAAGLAITRDGDAVLHTDALGLQELYVRQIGDAVYFALRIDPLLELNEAPVHVNLTAWVSTLLLTCPVLDATPFVEVSRVRPATAWRAGHGGITTQAFDPEWRHEDSDRAISPEDMVEIIAEHLPRRRLRTTAVSLSGGWDSRLLAVLARRSRTSRVTAWTADPDNGYSVDMDCAVEVANALGLRSHVVPSPPEAWLDDHPDVRRRLQYQTWMHTWLMPLARELRGRRTPVLSGFLGDTLFRKLTPLYEEAMRADSRPGVKAAMRNRVTSGVLRYPAMFGPRVADMLADLGYTAWDGLMASVEHHPDMLMLCRMHLNTRSVGPAFHWLFGPETEVFLPLAHPDVVAASLRIPFEARAENRFYKAMQHHASARIAEIPSTNDPYDQPPMGPRRQTSPAALAAMAETITGREDVVALLGPELGPALGDPDEMARRAQWNPPLHTLLWASMLAQWLNHYRHRLPADPLSPATTPVHQ